MPNNWHQLLPTAWAAVTFVLGIYCKNLLDSYFKRREETQTFVRDKRTDLLEQQLSRFYWPLYMHLQKDNLIEERRKERVQDEDDPHSILSKKIDEGVILPTHKEAVSVIESNLHLAGDQAIIDVVVLYMRHVMVYQMLRDAGLKDDPINHGHGYPKDIFTIIEERTRTLQEEYDRLIA
jgi:hypothetical protein